jgi:hypothetical protein
MTREEEIKQASEVIRGYQYGPTLARQGFVEGAQWADAHPHWISVEERLPDLPLYVLILDEREEVRMARLVSYKNEWKDCEDNMFCLGVTHWMPLPALPEGGKQ